MREMSLAYGVHSRSSQGQKGNGLVKSIPAHIFRLSPTSLTIVFEFFTGSISVVHCAIIPLHLSVLHSLLLPQYAKGKRDFFFFFLNTSNPGKPECCLVPR